MRSPDQLAVAELAALAQQAVDQRGLAVVDVGDDRDVADVGATGGGGIGLDGGARTAWGGNRPEAGTVRGEGGKRQAA